MDVILIRKNIERGSHTRLPYSLFVPVVFILMLTVASLAYSAYYHYGGQASKSSGGNNYAESRVSTSNRISENKPYSSQDNIEELALRVSALQIEAVRLNKWGKQLVQRSKTQKSNFSVSWDRIITKQQHPTKAIENTQWRFSNHSQRFLPKTSAAQLANSIKIVPKNLLRKYRSRTQSLPNGWPLRQGRISSGFGQRGRRLHKGIDIAAQRGTDIFAVESGTVVYSKYMRGYGQMVEIKHSSMYSTRYAHNSENLVEVGEKIDKGQLIALVGSTGRSTGPHVHFEVRQSGIAINPLKYLGAMDSFTLSENIKLSENVKFSKKK